MRWEDREQGDNVEDRRNSGGGRRGMPSLSTMMFLWPIIQRLLGTKFGWAIIGIGAFLYFSGFNPLDTLTKGGSSVADQKANDRQVAFISTVLNDTEEVWKEIFKQHGAIYREPTLVLYRGNK